MGVAGGAGIPNIGDCAGGADPTPCGEGLANRRVYSLGPACTGAGGAAWGGVGAERGGAAGELNSFVYSPPPDGAGGGAGAGGTPGLAPEKELVAPPGSTGGYKPPQMQKVFGAFYAMLRRACGDDTKAAVA